MERWSWDHPSWGIRVYRTAGGLRLAITHQRYDVERGFDSSAISGLAVDPLYLRLCSAQKSYRARLTPKPWRLGVSVPQCSWPFETSKQKDRFDVWEKEYVALSEKFAVCELVKTLGNSSVLPEFSPLIALHDRLTKAESGLPLA